MSSVRTSTNACTKLLTVLTVIFEVFHGDIIVIRMGTYFIPN